MGFCVPTTLSAGDAPRQLFDIPAGEAANTLKQFAAQSAEQLLYSPVDVSGVTTNAVKGEFTSLVALEQMLEHTPLKARQDETTKAIAITASLPSRAPPPASVTAPAVAPVTPSETSDQPRTAQTKPAENLSVKPRKLLTVLASWFAVAAAADAQSVPDAGAKSAEETVKLEAFTVTGSNIKRLDMENVLPVTTVTAEQMNIRDAGQPSDFLTALPQATGLPGSETAAATQNARGDNASLSFRGLPSGNTLILLNGRRLAPHPISWKENAVPALSTNVNQLPNRGIERVDVLRDGASSIYGADAVAGVVNYSMQKRFRGTEISLRYGETDQSDGAEVRATLTHGLDFAKGKGRAVLTADFYNRQALYLRDRSFSSDGDSVARAPAPWNVWTNTSFNSRATSSEYGQFALGSVTGTDAYGTPIFVAARPAGIPASYATTAGLFVITPLASGGVGLATAVPARAATGPGRDYYWNSNAYRVIQPQSTRASVYLGSEYDLNAHLTAFTDLSMYQAHSITYREPDTYSATTDGFLVVPVTNPYNPFGNRFWSPTGAPNTDGTPRLTGTPTPVSVTTKRFGDLPTRVDTVTDSVYRGVAGLRGKLLDSWTWEAALLYSTARGIEYEPIARRSLLAAAVNQSDATKAFNPFTRSYAVQGGALVDTGRFANSASVVSSILGVYNRSGITKLGSGDFRASGDLLKIWGGNTIGGAFGGEFRYEAFDDYRPPYVGLNPASSGLNPLQTDFVSASSVPDTHGNRHIASAYAETVIPLVGREFKLPLVQSLELSAAARYESYTDFGATTKPKYGVNWKPASWIMVRGSYNRGFHAPSLPSLFSGSFLGTALSSNDSYRSSVTQLATDSSANRSNLTAGNPKLLPETSTGKSAGIVIEVPHVRGLSVSVDYWEIRQKDVISTSGGVPDDTAALQKATQAALAAGQNINSIDLGSGTANYQGDPSVVRLPVTQQDKDLFAAYNARQAAGNQRAVVGAIDYLRTTYFNKSQQFVNGFDFDINYRVPQTRLGNFTFDTNWTMLTAFYANTAAGLPRTEYMATDGAPVGGASPKWRGATTLSWHRKQWGAGVGYYYVGRFTDQGATTTQVTWDSLGNPGYVQPVFTNGAYSYRYVVHDSKTYNVYLSYRVSVQNRWLNDTNLRLGVNNVLDAKPPLSTGGLGYDPTVYNVMARGRSYSFTLTKKL